jgi:RHS repeat-associated protein
MLTFNDKTIAYYDNGNMTSVTNSCGITTYTWDARNRLAGISGFNSDCSPLTASFRYDALGRRIEKTINAKTIQYLYDGLDIIQEIKNGIVYANYIRTLNIDEPLARIKSDGTVRYYQQDGLGSVVALTDETGVIKTQYVYDPFGNVTVSGEPSDNPFQYTGRENDGTGLYYYRARYYNPELQRFISEDPIGLLGGINKFVYVGNNAINSKDPFGLWEFCIPWFSSYGSWEDIGEPSFRTEGKAVMNDFIVTVGTCFWYKIKGQRQGRDVTHQKLCCGRSCAIGYYCTVVECGNSREYRDQETIVESKKTHAYMITGHSEADRPGCVTCRNPWTGRMEKVCN